MHTGRKKVFSAGTNRVLRPQSARCLVVVSTSSFAVLVEHQGAADQERPDRERHELAELRALDGALAAVVARGEGSGQQLGQADEDEGSRAQEDDDGDLGVGEGRREGEDDDYAPDGAQRGHEVVGERLPKRPTKWC